MTNALVWKSQPIFISSTFSDMMAERDALRDIVFKELDEKLQDRRIRLEPIDLRWGIETAIEKELKERMVLKVCLDEIDRCKPFFIGIIGDRYGSLPPEERMKDAETEKGFVSKLKNKSVTALEIEYGVLENQDNVKRSLFFFREPFSYDQMPESVRSDYCDEYNSELKEIDSKKRLKEFKELIIRAVGEDHVFTYKAEWDGEGVTGLENFINQVTEHLWKQIDSQTSELEDSRPKTWQDEERKYLEDFIEDRTVAFSGREDIISDLKLFALTKEGYENWGKCITGESGSGKSALFAKLYKELSKEDILILPHAAGISLRSNNLVNMLTLWIEVLADELKIDIAGELREKTKYDDLTKLFVDLLSQMAVNKRVVVLVDALNQFERTAEAKCVNWLPEFIPANAKFIFTSIPGSETNSFSARKGVYLEKLRQIKKTDARKIINILCARYHKKLDKDAINILLGKKNKKGKPSYSNPLWLTMAVDKFLLMDEDDFAEMKIFKGNAEQKLKLLLISVANMMPGDLAGMYDYIFDRSRKFGTDFVNGVLSYIGISRNGLRESDLELLINNYTNTKWNSLNFALVRRYLRNHLIRKGELGLWDFRHTQGRESLQNSLKSNTEIVLTLHKNMAKHLEEISDDDPLHLTEIIWHLFKCNDKEKTAKVYGTYWADFYKTGYYSDTIKEILTDRKTNTKWLLNVIGENSIEDLEKRYIVNNVLFNLEERIINHIDLTERLKISQKIKDVCLSLWEKHIYSFDYFRDLYLAYQKVGTIYQELGETNSALISYTTSLQIAKDLYRSSNTAESARDLYLAYQNIGDIQIKLGENNMALKNYRRLLKLNDITRKRNPDSAIYALDLTSAYNKVGMIHQTLGELKRAMAYYTRSLKISLKFYQTEPDSAEYARELSVAYIKVGEIYHTWGDLIRARANYTNALRLREELYKKYPDTVSYARDLCVSYNKVGDIHLALFEFYSSKVCYGRALLIAGELYNKIPDSAENTRDMTVCLGKYGDVHHVLRETQIAMDCYSVSVQFAEELSQRFPDSAEYAWDLTVSYTKVGNIHQELGEFISAQSNYNSAVQIAEELRERYPESADIARGLSMYYIKVGDNHKASGDIISAQAYYTSALHIAEELHKRHPDSAVFARDLVISYYSTDNFEKQKEAFFYMKNNNMYLDPPLLHLCKLVEIE